MSAAVPRREKISEATVKRLEREFFDAFGRNMTPEEKRMLLWAEEVAPSEPDDDPEAA